jgi:hypothetical protein
MRRRLTAILAAVGLVSGFVPVLAHHSDAAEFDSNQPVSLKGALTKVEWVNPHGWFYMDVKQPDGKVVNWAIQAGSPTAMLRRGFRKTDFPAGLELSVEGFRGRSGKAIAFGKSVKLPDGRELFSGFIGGGGTPRPQ